MIDTKALREKVLDLAIRGKLVPQDPNDEPASVLLERIRAEKEQMVKDGKLKAKDIKNDTIIFKGDDNLHYEQFPDGTVKCIEDEIPFELPEGWAWSRFASAFIINPRNSLPDDMEVSFIPMPLIREGYANEHTYEEKTWKTVKSGFTHFANNDVGVAKITPCFENKKSVVFKNLKNGYGAGTTELHIIRAIDNLIYPEYILWNLKTDDFIGKGINAFSGAVGQKRIGKDFIENSLIPIAPTNEQKRIIECISTTFMYIDDIDSSKKSFNADIQVIKSKILDLAIRGKLVPQNPDDEPASILLERIRDEKEELIKAGKIKRDKKESVIFKGEDNSYYEKIDNEVVCIDDELPFEIPSGWCWCRLHNLFNVCSSKRVLQADWRKEGIPFYRAREIVKLSNSGAVNNELFISVEHYESLKNNYGVPRTGDIMVTGVGTIGKVYIVTEKDQFYYKDASVLCFENRFSSIVPKFAKIMIDSRLLQTQIHSKTYGNTVDTITISTANNYLCVLPPKKEQQRIVEAVNTISQMFINIEQSLN